MAVAQVRVLPTSGTQGNNTNTITVAFDATGCDYLIVRFTYGADAGGSVATYTVTTATYAGVAMTALKAFRVNSGSNSAGQATYGIATPATGTNNVVITMSGSPGSPRLNLEVIGLSGVGSAALAASNDDTNATQSASLSATLAAGDMVVGCFNHGDTISGAATGTQATVNNYSTTTAGSCGIIITNTGTGTVSVRGNSSISDHWMGDAVQLTAAASASNPYYLDRTKLEPPGNLGPGSTWARPIGSYAAPAGVTHDGTVAATLGAFTSSASGTVTHTGTSARTLGSFTSSASGTVTHAGTSARTLGIFTSSAAGSVTHVGTSARTLGSFTSAASGKVTHVGTAATTLSAFTSSAVGKVTHIGTVAATLAAFTSNAQGDNGTAAPAALPVTPMVFALNRLAGTINLEAAGAANVWAGTSGLEVVGALNHKAGLSGFELNGVARELARMFSGDASLDVDGALSSIPTDLGMEGLMASLSLPQRFVASVKRHKVAASVGGVGVIGTATALLKGILL